MEFTKEQQEYIDKYYLRCPCDADGVPIRVGDAVEFGPNRNQGIVKALNERMVIAIHVDCDYTNYAKYGLLWDTDSCRHVKSRTLEDVLAEFADMPERIDRIAATKRYADEIRELMGVGE